MEDYEDSDFKFLSAHEVDPDLLYDFYRRMYPKRTDFFKSNWKWLYRSSFYDNRIPLVILVDNKVIAHAGLIPIKVRIAGKPYTASWYVDFAVVPEFQRKGLGIRLTKMWMEFSDLNITFCNDRSMGIFKKYGWKESFDTYYQIHPVIPFDHPNYVRKYPGFVRKILNVLARPYLKLMYNRYAYPKEDVKIEGFTREAMDSFIGSRPYLKMMYNRYAYPKEDVKIEGFTREAMDSFIGSLEDASSEGKSISPVRDPDFINWRLLESPERGKYKVFRTKGISCIVKLDVKYGNEIDMLWTSDLSDFDAVRSLIASLAIWGMNNGYSHIRFYTSKKELSDHLSKSMKPHVKHPRFAFYSEDGELLLKMEQGIWNWELLDSDLERL
jgi:hypothetical protein